MTTRQPFVKKVPLRSHNYVLKLWSYFPPCLRGSLGSQKAIRRATVDYLPLPNVTTCTNKNDIWNRKRKLSPEWMHCRELSFNYPTVEKINSFWESGDRFSDTILRNATNVYRYKNYLFSTNLGFFGEGWTGGVDALLKIVNPFPFLSLIYDKSVTLPCIFFQAPARMISPRPVWKYKFKI